LVQGSSLRPRVRDPETHRHAVPDQVPVPVRGRIAAAARRGDRRGRARASPPRTRGAGRAARDEGSRSAARVHRDDGRGCGRAPGARPERRGDHHPRRGTELRRGWLVMAIGWYLVVSALIFCIGAGGVLTRRNPLVVLLCLELMLNAANLALVAFSRMWGGEDGQVFALIVMVVAACEGTVGLGLIGAMYLRQLPIA